MNTKNLRYFFIISLTALAIESCKVTQTYQAPDVNTTNLFRDVNTTDTNSLANLRWNEVFTDTTLQRLIREGIANNIDLQTAYTRITQAEAYFEQSRAAFLPTLNANAGVTRSKFSAGQGFGARPSITSYQLGASSSWEADIWGRLGSSRRANLANLLQSQAAARAVQTGVVSSIANFYFTLLALDQQLLITEQTVSNWDTTVTTMRALKEAARVTEAAVVQSEAQRYAAEVTIPDLKQSIRETENTLSIILGHAPTSIFRGNLLQQATLPMLTTGVPAQLLANRPDVQQAEFAYRNAFELTNVARAAFYPALVINGSAGFASLTLWDIVNPTSIAASVGAAITQPIFNRRLNRTNLVVARAQQDASFLNFRNALLNAGQEVSNAVSLNQAALEKVTIRSNQIDALERSVQYSQELLRNGFATYTEVIQARQSLLQAQLGRVNDRLQQFQATVDLYRSLGGGWR
ncbi:efflux transporter outer membrane subunit [Segetibacter aerophilus]|uniref:Multidrug transporter n=1 Tax=Segetibacter aerophilus TaxID=670293 RepID=A0A512B7S3_9BACT|nr:efflux transporter outer membrane subunit [Segetibacter aerophilus]GEO08008.1 multidrug transporter [Segetibacter aerophilus]